MHSALRNHGCSARPHADRAYRLRKNKACCSERLTHFLILSIPVAIGLSKFGILLHGISL
ncbi:unnamed protein product [Protopolystoma xenopodis]|uniref:Uncharacterized protein n=1 Tax=Protopolystoma xenopodis TaxID=117903 RepID=A0A3S4ZYG4_9PLAT|nr:unnamed protein product [Protopolystoma xenopodis]